MAGTAQISSARPAVQRFLNKGSGRMETRGAMKAYHQQTLAGKHARPQRQGGQKQQGGERQPSFIQETPGQILARARQIVNSEVQAETLPFRQRATRLPAEEQGVQAAHTATYGKLDTGTAALQTAQAGSAKTFENVAADAVKKAEESGKTSEAAEKERFGGSIPASLAQQAEQNRTLLQSIAASGQAGTNARQQAESSFLTNLRATGQQTAAAGTRAIQGEYTTAQQKNADQEAQVRTTKPGRVGRLYQGLAGEQQKIAAAREGLGLKAAGLEQKETQSQRTAATTRRGQRLTAEGRAQALGSKEREGAANRAQRERASERTAATAAASRLQKLEEKHNKATGKAATKEQTSTLKEIADTYTAYETIVRNRTLGKGGGKKADQITYIHQHLPKGKAGELAASNPWALRAGQELWYTHKVSKATRQALGRLGLNIGYDPEIFKAVNG